MLVHDRLLAFSCQNKTSLQLRFIGCGGLDGIERMLHCCVVPCCGGENESHHRAPRTCHIVLVVAALSFLVMVASLCGLLVMVA